MGGTLVRHEVTATHTRSLFCSLQRFFFPSALVVAILLPIVHKESRGVAALPESHALCHPQPPAPPFGNPCTPFAASVEIRSARVASPSLSPGRSALLCSEILTAPQLSRTKYCPRALLVLTVRLACRDESSPLVPCPERSGVSPTLRELGESAEAVPRAADFETVAVPSLRVFVPGRESPARPHSPAMAPGFC